MWSRSPEPLALLCCLLFLAPSASGRNTVPEAPAVVGHIRPAAEADQRSAYFIDMLRLALDRTLVDFGPYRLREAPVTMSQSRALHSLERSRYIDVVWTMTNREREERFRPVRIPLLRGLLGVRVPVVRRGEASLFDQVRTLEELKKLRAGQGHDWPDTTVLRAAGIPITTAGYVSLFRMLRAGRFDFMPRSVSEIWAERDFYREYGLEPTWKLLLVYRAPIYYFVRKDDEGLARRLETGLQRALDDGSFDELFRAHPGNREAFGHMDEIPQRRIYLDNPELTAQTPVDVERFWYGPIFGEKQSRGAGSGEGRGGGGKR